MQTAEVEGELEQAHTELNKQQLKEAEHKEKIQNLLDKAEPLRVSTHFS